MTICTRQWHCKSAQWKNKDDSRSLKRRQSLWKRPERTQLKWWSLQLKKRPFEANRGNTAILEIEEESSFEGSPQFASTRIYGAETNLSSSRHSSTPSLPFPLPPSLSELVSCPTRSKDLSCWWWPSIGVCKYVGLCSDLKPSIKSIFFAQSIFYICW